MQCNKYLRGILHQERFCENCNIVLNRICSSSDLPICELYMNAQSSHNMSINDNKFGLSLCFQFNQELTNAPEIIRICCNEIEKKATNLIEIDLYNCLYQKIIEQSIVKEICDDLNKEFTIELCSYPIDAINGALKKFLRDLPDPVIPVQFYHPFIEAASKSNMFKLHVTGHIQF